MTNKLLFLISFLSIGMILISCSDDDADTASQVSPEVSFQFRVGSDTFNEGDTYTINSTAIQIDFARFYIGNFAFSGDSNFEQNEDYFIIGGDNTSINLGSIEEGTYNFSFGIGIDAENNSQTSEDFASRPREDPLAAQETSMHWNWMSGYKFMRIDGMVDTNNDGAVDTEVQYHLGTDAFFTNLDSPFQHEITPDNNDITIRFDLRGLFLGVNISNGDETHVTDNPDMANQMLDNFSEAFSVLN